MGWDIVSTYARDGRQGPPWLWVLIRNKFWVTKRETAILTEVKSGQGRLYSWSRGCIQDEHTSGQETGSAFDFYSNSGDGCFSSPSIDWSWILQFYSVGLERNGAQEMEKAKGVSAPGRKGHCSRSSNSWSGAVPLRVSKGFAGWGGWRHFYKVGEIKIFNSLS